MRELKFGRTDVKNLQDKVLEKELHRKEICRSVASFLRIHQSTDQHMHVRGLLKAREGMICKGYSRVAQCQLASLTF